MRQLKAKITANTRIASDFHNMCLRSPYLANNIRPGQFVEVRCSDSLVPLLRRPFSVHRILEDGIEILYEVIGKGTEALSQRKSGELLDVIGPLGNGFTLNAIRHPLPPKADPLMAENAILVAGGMGVAPLVALAEKLAHRKNKEIYVVIGACKKSHILCEKEFKKFGAKILIATEDGSQGKKGLVTDLLKKELKAYSLTPTAIYACGPNAMLKAVAKIAVAKKIPCQVSLEERMACGIGVCLGCPVKIKGQGIRGETQGEYKMVCKDGPIFDAEEIIW